MNHDVNAQMRINCLFLQRWFTAFRFDAEHACVERVVDDWIADHFSEIAAAVGGCLVE